MIFYTVLVISEWNNVLVLIFDYNCGVKGQSGWRNMENWTKPERQGRQKEAQALLICPNALESKNWRIPKLIKSKVSLQKARVNPTMNE